jgi:hypothetical protein
MTAFTVESVRHRALGPLVRLRVGEAPALDLTPDEAAILSRALSAVQGGRSPEHTIFMSPIASDGDFTATVEGDGLAVGDGEQHRLSWPEVERLAGLLAGA